MVKSLARNICSCAETQRSWRKGLKLSSARTKKLDQPINRVTRPLADRHYQP